MLKNQNSYKKRRDLTIQLYQLNNQTLKKLSDFVVGMCCSGDT